MDSVALAFDLASLGPARDRVRSLVELLDGDPSAAELVTTELVTNAIRHGAAPVELTLRPDTDRDAVVIAVSDTGERLPVPRRPQPGEGGGRGLLLVEAMSAEWGVSSTEHGKSVWAVVTITPSPS